MGKVGLGYEKLPAPPAEVKTSNPMRVLGVITIAAHVRNYFWMERTMGFALTVVWGFEQFALMIEMFFMAYGLAGLRHLWPTTWRFWRWDIWYLLSPWTWLHVTMFLCESIGLCTVLNWTFLSSCATIGAINLYLKKPSPKTPAHELLKLFHPSHMRREGLLRLKLESIGLPRTEAYDWLSGPYALLQGDFSNEELARFGLYVPKRNWTRKWAREVGRQSLTRGISRPVFQLTDHQLLYGRDSTVEEVET